MELFFKAMADMEAACDSEAVLLATHLPDVSELVNALKQLPMEYQLDLRDRLERIQVIMESQMLVYASETEQLREAIRTASAPKPRAKAEGEIAFIHINPSLLDNAVPTTMQ